MRERKRQVSDKNVSGGERDYFDKIPVDLVLGNILSRLPVKSMAKCRCVSKHWSSIIRRRNNSLLFPIKPPDTPRLLFAFKFCSTLFYSSSPQGPQPQNPDNDSSLVLTHHHMRFITYPDEVCRPVRGLVCSSHIRDGCSWAVISNPITGENVITPEVIMRTEMITPRALYRFGYDPIDKQFKVLRITWYFCPLAGGHHSGSYHVLTLGTGNRNILWKKIQCCTLHYPIFYDNGVCIDGVLFYLARIDDKTHRMVCFNIRSEEFSFISVDMNIDTSWILINYKGKLGVCSCNINPNIHFELWVLEDAKKHKWSKHNYQLPPSLSLMDAGHLVGMSDSGEIVFSSNPCHIYYYNLESNITTRVKIDIPGSLISCRIHTFVDYVEDGEFM